MPSKRTMIFNNINPLFSEYQTNRGIHQELISKVQLNISRLTTCMIALTRDKTEWLVDRCLTARQHRKVNLCQQRRGTPAQTAKDGQRDTMQDTLIYTMTMEHSITLQLHKHNNWLSNHMTYFLNIVTFAPSPTQHALFQVISFGVDALHQKTRRQ